MGDLLGNIIEWMQDIGPAWRAAAAFLGILLETSVLVGLVVPGDTIVLVAATGVTDPVGFVTLVLAVILGALIGESIGFALGRYFGPKIQSGWLGRKIGADNWERAQIFLERRGGIAVFVSRFLPVLHSLIPVTVGASTMRYRTFLAWTFPACVLWTLLYVSVGSSAAGAFDTLSDNVHLATAVFAGIIVAFVLVVFLAKKWLVKSTERHMRRAEIDPASEPERTDAPDDEGHLP